MDESTWKVHGGINLSHWKTLSGEEIGGAVNRCEGVRWRQDAKIRR